MIRSCRRAVRWGDAQGRAHSSNDVTLRHTPVGEGGRVLKHKFQVDRAQRLPCLHGDPAGPRAVVLSLKTLPPAGKILQSVEGAVWPVASLLRGALRVLV